LSDLSASKQNSSKHEDRPVKVQVIQKYGRLEV